MTDPKAAYADAYNAITLALMRTSGAPIPEAAVGEHAAAVRHLRRLWADLSPAEQALLLGPDTAAEPIDPAAAMQARIRSKLH